MGTLKEIFGVRSLMAPAVSLFEDLEPWPLVELFMSGIEGERIEGNEVRWDREDMTRELAPFTDIDAGSIALFGNDRDHYQVPMASIRVKRFIPGRKVWIDERGLGSLKADASQHVRRAMRHLENAMRRSAEFLCSQALFNPTGISVTPTNVPGSEVSFDVDFSIPSSTATTSWATETTGIVSDAELLGMIDTTINVSGMTPQLMIMNSTGANMIWLNDAIEAWLQTTPEGVRTLNKVGPGGVMGVKKTAFPNTFGGIAGIGEWWQLDHGYQNIGGSFTKYLSTDNFVMGPGPGPTLGFGQGLNVVPTNAIGSDGLDMVDVRPGPVTYAILKEDPVGIEIIRKWDFIPVVLLPEAWRRIDPTP